MFDNLNYPKSLDEERFESWLEKGRKSKLGYNYLLVVWNMYEEDFQPTYIDQRSEIEAYVTNSSSQEVPVAAYDLYSESRVHLAV